MDIKELETAIVTKIKEALPDLLVEAYPDHPSSFKMIHPKGAILVHYSGSRFLPSLFEEVIVQERKVSYDLILLNRSLRSNGGIYDTMDKVREALTGFQVAVPLTSEGEDPLRTNVLPLATKFYPLEEEFILEENGLWQYGMRFECFTKQIEKGYEI
jgi:hypothetical protein